MGRRVGVFIMVVAGEMQRERERGVIIQLSVLDF